MLYRSVTIATIADVMELTKENRALVKEGLRLLSNTSSPGLRAIIKVNELEDKPISVYHIGFVIGPCFNAAGRLETADLAFRLLRSTDDLEAEALALQLKRLNDERKHLTELAMNRGIELAESPQYNADHVLVIPLEDCHESIVGIVAGRIKEHTGKPTIVLAQVASDYSKGSGRSIPAYSMYEEMARFSDLFVKFGGHAMAAGLTICNQNIDKLRERLNSRQQLTEKDFIQKIYIDAEVVFRHMTESVVKYLYMLEPYGNGNQKPIFASRHIKIQRAVRLGKNKNVLKMYLEDAMGDVLEAIMFQGVEEFLEFIGDEFGQEQRTNVLQGYNNEVELAFSFFPDINEYKGRKNVQLIIQDYKRMKRSGCV